MCAGSSLPVPSAGPLGRFLISGGAMCSHAVHGRQDTPARRADRPRAGARGVYHQCVAGDRALDVFHPLTAEWFARAFADPTDAQRAGWPPIAAGEHTLLLAPTGSGKTLAAFLWALDRIMAARLAGSGARSGALHLAAQGAQLRRRAQPRGSAGGPARRGRAGRACPAGDHGRGPHRRHPAARTRAHAAPPARRADHDAREPVADADLPGALGARRRADGDRRRDPLDRRHQARGTPGALARAARVARRRPGRRPAAHRALGDPAPARRRSRAFSAARTPRERCGR